MDVSPLPSAQTGSQIETAEEKVCKGSIMNAYWDKQTPLLKKISNLSTGDTEQLIKETNELGDQLAKIDHDF
jgi:hypothetical protein